LGRFVRFIEKLQESGAQWSGAEPSDSAANAVRIMSVHKSKGLEFPVVILAELGGKFNLKDAQRDILLGTDVSIGLTVVDRDAKAKLAGTAHQILAREKRLKNLAEEMRILYVAMTRAKERLVLTGCCKKKNIQQILTKGYHFGDGVPNGQLRKCGNSLEWILYALSNNKVLHELLSTGCDVDDDNKLLTAHLYESEGLNALSEYLLDIKNTTRQKPAKKEDTIELSGLLDIVKANLSWQYDNIKATQLPAKQSVTQLTHHSDEYIKIDCSHSLDKRPNALDITQANVVEGRIVGSATHAVISKIDLCKFVDVESVQAVIEDMVGEGCFSYEAAKFINIDSIVRFFDSELGQTALNTSNKVMREWPFTFSLPASGLAVENQSRVTGHETQDTIVVQGIIDMLIDTPKG